MGEENLTYGIAWCYKCQKMVLTSTQESTFDGTITKAWYCKDCNAYIMSIRFPIPGEDKMEIY